MDVSLDELATADAPGLLVREELQQLARLGAEEPNLPEGYWFGSATSAVTRWRDRALAAERQLADLRTALATWRPST